MREDIHMGRREYRRAPNADNRTSARPPRASEARLLERLTGHGLYVAGVALGLLPWSGGAPDIMDGFLCAGAWACLVTWAVMAVRRGRGMIWRPILAFVVLGQSTMFLDLLNRHRDSIAYNIIDLDRPASKETLDRIRGIEGVIRVREIVNGHK